MDKFPQIWRIIVPVTIGLLLYGFVVVVWNRSYHGLSVLMSDHMEFEYDHNLPRGYDSKTTGYLEARPLFRVRHHADVRTFSQIVGRV